MTTKSINLIWIVVNDLKKAIKFYTDVLGMQLSEHNEQFKWAELKCKEGGATLGIAERSESEQILPGQNAVVAFTVENLEKSKNEMAKKGTKMKGEVLEIPGVVKMQTAVDADGNHFQIVELLS